MSLLTTREWKEKHSEHIKEYNRLYTSTHHQEHNTRQNAQRREHPERLTAYIEVERALATGILTRTDKCERCNRMIPVNAHHADYDKPLEVEWLCASCHRREHGHL